MKDGLEPITHVRGFHKAFGTTVSAAHPYHMEIHFGATETTTSVELEIREILNGNSQPVRKMAKIWTSLLGFKIYSNYDQMPTIEYVKGWLLFITFIG
jgi:hypothetical protein